MPLRSPMVPFFLTLLLLVPALPLEAQVPVKASWENSTTAGNATQPPEGLEDITAAGLTMRVPKGMRFRREGGNLLVWEDPGLYLGRRTAELEKRIIQLEETQQKLLSRIDELERRQGQQPE